MLNYIWLGLILVAVLAIHTAPGRRLVLSYVQDPLAEQYVVNVSTDDLRYNLFNLSTSLRNLQLGKRGLELVQNESWDAALAEFLASRKLFPTRVALKNAALSLRQLKRNVEALAMYNELLAQFGTSIPPDERKTIDDAKEAEKQAKAEAERQRILEVERKRREAEEAEAARVKAEKDAAEAAERERVRKEQEAEAARLAEERRKLEEEREKQEAAFREKQRIDDERYAAEREKLAAQQREIEAERDSGNGRERGGESFGQRYAPEQAEREHSRCNPDNQHCLKNARAEDTAHREQYVVGKKALPHKR